MTWTWKAAHVDLAQNAKEIAHNLYALPELSNRPTCEFMQLVPFEWPFAAMR